MDFQALHEKHPEMSERLNRLENSEKKAQSFLALRDSLAMKELISELEEAIRQINDDLLTKKMTEKERDILFVERHSWEWLLNKFTGAELTIKRIEEFTSKL